MSDRQRLRSRLLLLGLLPALVATGFAAKTAHLLHHSYEGASALAVGDPDAARRAYASTSRLNVVEPWVAPYNEGIAAYLQAGAAGASAVELFEVALALAPPQEQCRVRHNLAMAIEAEGDAEVGRDLSAARERWFQARTTLRTCLPGASGSAVPDTEERAAMTAPEVEAIVAVDRCLARKLVEVEQSPEPDPDQPFKGRDADFGDLTPREQEELLALRNEEGQRASEKARARRAQADPDAEAPRPEDQSTDQPSENPVYNW